MPKGTYAFIGLALLLAGCQSAPEPSRDYLEYASAQDPSSVSSRIAENVGNCWFAGSRAGFEDYSYAPELNSFSGKPRVLIVPKSDPGGLPKLVIEASAAGRGTSVKLFGPLMGSAQGSRIAADVARWTGGATGCSA